MKYIDAEKLKAEIDKLESFSCISEEQDGFYSAISRINDIIDSLQQEQDLIIINKKDWEAQEQFRKNKDFGKPLQQEQPAKRGYKDCNGCEYNRLLKDQIGWQFRGCFGGDYKGKPIAEIELCPLKVAQQEQGGVLE